MANYRFGTKLKSMVAPIYWDNVVRNFNHKIQIIYGGASSGKSYAIAQRVVLDTIRGRNTLVIRKTSNSMKSSCFNEILSKISDFGLMYLFKVSLGDFTITCLDNNRQIIFKGLDDPEKIKSIKPIAGVITDIWIEEATQVSYDDYQLLKTRLRGKTPFKKRITMSFNPIIKTHWIYKQFFEGFWQDNKQFVEDKEKSILKTTYKDNNFLTQDDIERLEAEQDPYYRNVYLLGNWGVLTGAVFSNYVVEDFDIESFNTYRFGLDWGFSCLVGDTQVITDKGNKAIKDIEVGDKVLTRDGYSKVTLKQSKGIKEVYAINFGKKNRIIATGDHRIYTSNGWKRVDELQELETVCVNKSKIVEILPILGTVKKSISAKYVELCSLLRHIIQEQPVLTSVPIKRQLLTEKKEVYDITVENGEFFANGILVHNCDPFACVKVAIDVPRRKLYICEEIYQKDLTNDQAIPMVKALVGSNVVWCDSAEPKSITEFRYKGINARPVKKGAGSVEQGVNFMKRFKIIIHPQCPNALAEFNSYRYKEDRKTGEVLPEIVDKDNHLIDAIRYALSTDFEMKGTIRDML